MISMIPCVVFPDETVQCFSIFGALHLVFIVSLSFVTRCTNTTYKYVKIYLHENQSNKNNQKKKHTSVTKKSITNASISCRHNLTSSSFVFHSSSLNSRASVVDVDTISISTTTIVYYSLSLSISLFTVRNEKTKTLSSLSKQ